jgi:hypothetical protein
MTTHVSANGLVAPASYLPDLQWLYSTLQDSKHCACYLEHAGIGDLDRLCWHSHQLFNLWGLLYLWPWNDWNSRRRYISARAMPRSGIVFAADYSYKQGACRGFDFLPAGGVCVCLAALPTLSVADYLIDQEMRCMRCSRFVGDLSSVKVAKRRRKACSNFRICVSITRPRNIC